MTCSVTKPLVSHTQAPDEVQYRTLEQLCLNSSEDVIVMKQRIFLMFC